MMGLFLQRVVAAALLALTFLLASPTYLTSPFVAHAETTEGTEAGGEKKETDSQKGNEQESEDVNKEKVDGAEKEKDSDGKPAELPPLDLGTGATVKESPKTEDVLAEGVTATASPKGGEIAGGQAPQAAGTDSNKLNPKMLWTPNSGRFLLKDRQAGLALASSADTEDKGDGKPWKPVPRTNPVTAKPVSNPTDEPSTGYTPVNLPTENLIPENESDGNPVDLPDFISDENYQPATNEDEINQPTFDDLVSQVEDPEPENSIQESPLVFGLNDNESTAGEFVDNGTVGIIRSKSQAGNGENPSGSGNSIFQPNEEVGENIVGVSPWRGLSVFLLCLGLIFLAYWAAQKFRGKLGGLPGKTLSVIETIGIGAGRQIIIIEMNDDALILGVTPNSINLLDKVPLATLNSGYSATVDSIISREGSALPGQWESRPRFDSAINAPKLAPPIQTGTYGSSGQSTTSVSELRRTRQTKQSNEAFAQVEEPPPPNNPKEELIGKFRSQLNRFE